MSRLWVMAALPPLVWGSTYLVTTEWLPPDRPLTAAVLRILPIGLLMVLITRYIPSRDDWLRLVVVSALCMSLLHWPLFVSAYRLPGGLAALLICTQPLLVVGFGWLLFRQRTGLQMILGVLLGLLGVAMVLVSPSRLVWDGIGVLAATVAAFSMALGTLLVKRWQLPIPLLAFTGWQLLLGGLLLLPFMLWFEGLPPSLSSGEVGGYLYLALLGTGAPYLLWFRALRGLDPVFLSILLLLSPLSALALGYWFLDQGLTGWQWAGAACVFAGIILSQWRFRAR
ncbi:EamA family transporter [Pseudomonas sp. G11-1]|uniref:EamA family transporter n=1 Tax=Halopseudomonas bauzanensis TaxID=653930 RepID=A0A4U0YTV2_9GAMM|nr:MULTISPECIES: EamA family transporter [Halopseudomonas]MCO5785803.1 EamA family transporter [Pseudomonas sp. G11-1]MCO5788093.1 EamA family transporter [Pseudomonas sp. G11-2]TKA93161.1 EamA family transporter [Halopseudomonas bauzanensis]WGK61387.1 EamA family transporter [Halopseudomonas sp. SMJS2]